MIPAPRSRRLVWRAVRGLWTLPTNIVGHAAGLLMSRSRPRRVGGPAAMAWLYVLPRGPWFDKAGAVTLGHAIVSSGTILAGPHGRLILAHELSHTRQHDWLGPLYLPLHGLAQLVSAVGYIVFPRRESTPQHAYNPLEQRFLCLGFDRLQACQLPFDDELLSLLEAFGV